MNRGTRKLNDGNDISVMVLDKDAIQRSTTLSPCLLNVDKVDTKDRHLPRRTETEYDKVAMPSLEDLPKLSSNGLSDAYINKTL